MFLNQGDLAQQECLKIYRHFCCQSWGFITGLCIETRDMAENSTVHKELSNLKYQ